MSGCEGGGSINPSGENLDSYLKHYARAGNHANRYLLAKRWMNQSRVLEIGCGYGAGACLLSPAYSAYIGVDTDDEAIRWARRVVRPKFRRADFLQIREFDASKLAATMDCAIAFEVLEHVDRPLELIRVLVDAVRPNGNIVLSTPNGVSSLHHRALFRSPYHVDEYDIEELNEILVGVSGVKEYFKQRRRDRFDVVALRRRLRGFSDGNPRSSTSGFQSNIISRLIATYLNGPLWWTALPSTPTQMGQLDYSTIIVKVTLTGHRYANSFVIHQ